MMDLQLTNNKDSITNYKSLNGYRAIFCCAICFFIHYHWLLTDGYGMTFPLGDGGIIRGLYKFGYYGVEFFFVLSGFVTENGYKERQQDDIFLFVFRKLKKHYPLLLITLMVSIALQFAYKCLTGLWFYVESVNVLSILMSILNVTSGWFIVDNNLNMPIWYLSVLMLQWAIFYILKKADDGSNDRFRIGALLMILLGLSILLGKNKEGPFYIREVQEDIIASF